jgi:hypothetical protein
MSIRRAFFVLGLAAFALPAAAQNVAGKWNGSIESPQGAFSMLFDFAVEGDVLKGTISNDFTGATPITDGKLDGNKLSFNTAFEGGPDGPIAISYTGMIEGDKITLTMGLGDAAAAAGGGAPEMPPMTLTRVPE